MPSTQESGKRNLPRRIAPAHSTLPSADRAPRVHESRRDALSVTPACDGVYIYTVPSSSEWTTTDLLCVLHDLVRSTSLPSTGEAGNAR